MKKQIIIIDYGSQYTLLIARTILELGYNCHVVSYDEASQFLTGNHLPKFVILSGGDKSVYAPGAPTLPEDLELTGKPYHVLGVCYGMQLLAHNFGGKVERDSNKSGYGPETIYSISDQNPYPESTAWMSHGDSVTVMPNGFYNHIITLDGTIAGITNESKTITGVQFHPEVSQTVYGKEFLKQLIVNAGCIPDWNPEEIIQQKRDEISKKYDISKKVLLGLSGGVDSSVTAALLAPLFGENLHAIIIDHGGLRQGERDEAIAIATELGVSFEVVDLADEFIAKISAIDRTNSQDYAEDMRKVFGKDLYKKIFEQKSIEIGASYIAQGTNAADLTESGKKGNSALIKSHHNVNLQFSLPEILPIDDLYKYQIRQIGKDLGLPEEIYNREPFPGPGLYLRIADAQVTRERLELVRQADHIVRSILRAHGLVEHISQLVIALLGCRVVGVRGDERAYDMPISIRAVVTTDFMTVEPFFFEKNVIQEITSKLTKIPGVSRVMFDYTPKPPGTTEYQ
jgi:GMP synthase (glutamine-hydrolysing)